jgi:VCBS repeat-containing protein
VKCFFCGFLFLLSVLLPQNVFAQEAKLVKQAEWGSGSYEHMVEINGYYYIETSSDQIDVINPTLTAESSLVGQIKFEGSIFSIAKFKDYLVVITDKKITVYSISEVINITEKYSVTVNATWERSAVFQDDYFFYVDSDSKIFIIEESDSTFSLASVIQSTESNYDDELSISSRNLFVEDSILYYLYDQNDQEQRSTKVESYQLEDFSLLDSGELDDIGKNEASVSVGNGRFVITSANYQYLYLIQLVDGQVNILNNFDGTQFHRNFKFAFKNNNLKAIWRNELYSFQVSESSTITTLPEESLSSYLSNSSSVNDLSWLDNKLIGLSDSAGLFEINFSDDTVASVTFAYNQSGYMGKAVIENDLIYLPRQTRIDVVDISNINTPVWRDDIPVSVNDIDKVAGNFIFANTTSISNQSLISDVEFQLNSEVEFNYIQGPILRKDSSIYNLVSDNGVKLMRHNTSSPYTLYESPKIIDFPDLTNICPQVLAIVSNKLLAADPCGNNRIHYFSGYDTAEIAYDKSIEHGFSYWQVAFGDEYIYFVDPQGIKVVALNDVEELEEIVTIDMTFSNTTGIHAEALGDYLLISDGAYFYLMDIAIADSPRLISKSIVSNSAWHDANFQIEGSYVLVTTKYQGQVKIFQINKAPITNTASLDTNEDESSAPLILFTDPELDPLTLSIIDNVVHGEAVIDGERLTYKPNENFNGEDTIVVKAEDMHGNFIEHELSITVNAVNDTPIILTNALSTEEDVVLTSALTFHDIENDDVEFRLIAEPTNGLASISLQGALTYQSAENFFGEDSLIVSITDENQAVSEKEIIITVNSVNDKPDVSDVSFSIDEDNLLSESLLATDIDSDVVAFSMVTPPQSGVVNLQDSGQFTYQPNTDYDQQDNFVVAVTDEQGAVSQATVIIDVNPVNDAPVLEENNFFTNEDVTLTQQVLFYDIDSGVHTFEITSPATNGLVEINDQAVFTYTPNDNFAGIEQFGVRLIDEHGASVEGIIKVTIAPVNDAPTFIITSYSVDEDSVLTSKLRASDIEEQALTFELVEDTDLQGTVNIESDGTFSFEPLLNFNGETSFTVKVLDSEAKSTTQAINITVAAVDDSPAPENNSVSIVFNGNVSESLPTVDVDGQSLSYSVIVDVKNGLLTLSEKGQYNYSPNAGFSGGDSFTYEVRDVSDNVAQATISFTVEPAPVPTPTPTPTPVEPNKTASSSGGSFGYLMLFILAISFSYRAKNAVGIRSKVNIL